MNKYHEILQKILDKGKIQNNKKGNIKYLLNQKLELKPVDLLEIFEGHGIARNKLKTELEFFTKGERLTERYHVVGLLRSYTREQLSDVLRAVAGFD